MSKFFGMDEDDDDPEMMESRPSTPTATNQPMARNVVSMTAAKPEASQIVVLEPRLFSDAKEIATQLMKGEAAIVNFSQVQEDQATRIIDFLNGTVYAINGDIRRVGDQIFLCTPHNFAVTGDVTRSLKSQF